MTNSKFNKPPHIGQWLLEKIINKNIRYEALGDFHEIFFYLAIKEGRKRAVIWYWKQVFESLSHFLIDTIYWRMDMYKNYVKIAYRNLIRYKGYSLINISGLAVGLTCLLLISLFVRHEMNYDQYHTDKERIYRVALEWHTGSATHSYAPNVPPLGPALKEHFPQVEQSARALYLGFTQVVKGNEKTFFEDEFLFADPEIFKILSIPFIQGDPLSALSEPKTIVINEAMALKYFETTQVLGKMLNMDGTDFKITGIVKNVTDNTHFTYTMFLPAKPLERMNWMYDWTWPGAYTYIKLLPNTDIEKFQEKLRHFNNPYVKKLPGGSKGIYSNIIQPLTDIHLKSNMEYELTAPGNTGYLIIFTMIGIFIIVIAAINFINMTTARSANRAKEVGIRKVNGAVRRQLVFQYLWESVFISLLALCLSFITLYFIIPVLNNLAGTSFIFILIMQPKILMSSFIITIIIGLLAGIYPALFLTAFKPVVILKGVIHNTAGKYNLRKIMVIGQFSISVLLIIGTIVVYKQLHFMKNKDLGFDKEQKMIITVQRRSKLDEKYKIVKNSFLSHPGIFAASVCGEAPGRGAGSLITSLIGEPDDKKQMMYYNHCDDDFIDQLQIELISGRSFNRKIISDNEKSCLINEAAVKAFGWNSPEEAIGKHLKEGLFGADKEIIGVTKNFHYRGLQIAVEPLVLQFNPQMFSTICLSVEASQLSSITPFVEKKWAELFPGQPLNYVFLDEDFNSQYTAEEHIGKLAGVFATLGIFIASLGLFGLSAFTTEQRTKEIGIRKVLGSSAQGIVTLLSKDYLKFVLTGNILAWPLGYFIMNQWLQNFAYRTSLDLSIFIITGIGTLLIALITVSFFSVKAAIANPVKVLKYE